ncbi:hypothetical protein [Chitinophaga deserti]|uniref:hypothetical protein n=1 Tax=Chitinophaga deserti TaxID=2164099 RepID=UPI001300BBA8|nr:hypothetical protein [Chitinophaga deserti]
MNSGYSRVVKDNHIKFSLRQENILFNGIGFNMARKFHLLQEQKPIDIVSPSMRTFGTMKNTCN